MPSQSWNHLVVLLFSNCTHAVSCNSSNPYMLRTHQKALFYLGVHALHLHFAHHNNVTAARALPPTSPRPPPTPTSSPTPCNIHRPSATRPCTHHGCCPPVGHYCSNWCVSNVCTIPDLHSCRKPPAAVAVAGAHRSIAISLPPTLHAPAPAPLPPPHLSSLQSARSTLEAPAMAQQFHSLSLEFLP